MVKNKFIILLFLLILPIVISYDSWKSLENNYVREYKYKIKQNNFTVFVNLNPNNYIIYLQKNNEQLKDISFLPKRTKWNIFRKTCNYKTIEETIKNYNYCRIEQHKQSYYCKYSNLYYDNTECLNEYNKYKNWWW